MISVERKYLLVFFIRWNKFLDWLKKLSRGRFAEFLERTGPIILFGPLLGKNFAPVTKEAIVLLLLTSLLMIGGPLASLATLLFGLMGSALVILGQSAFNILFEYATGGTPLPGIGPVIPGVPVGPYYIPFLEGWLSILLIFLIHEGAHGIVSIRKKIDIRDSAMVLLGFIPVAAYVMPDEEKFKGSPPQTKVSILAAGPTSNIVFFVLSSILLLSLTFLFTPVLENYIKEHALGVRILDVPETIEFNGKTVKSLVHGIIEPGDVILSINGQRVYTLKDVIEALKNAEGNQIEVAFLHNGEERTITIPNKGYLGVKGAEIAWKDYPPLGYRILSFILSFLAVFTILNLAVAVVNALPFSIFDGGQAIEELGKVKGLNTKPLKTLALLLVIFNLLPWFVT